MPTAVESHIANATLSLSVALFIHKYQILNSRYGVQVDTVRLIADGLKLRALILFQTTKNPSHCCNGFSYWEPGDDVVPTAVESHIANATLSLSVALFIHKYQILNSRYGVQVDTVRLIADGLKLRALILFQTTKNPSHCCNGFSYWEPGDDVVPTAVESHIANATLSLSVALFIHKYQILNSRYGVQVDTVRLIADGLKLRALILFQTTKNPSHCCNGFL
ncbi:hypothetical protein PMAG_a2027 [Pseudoalteromonas mariniglutinosa NCIMB 1770]|nr:hypothetical protein [Pseudoalteromonas mariniglutinosa NCIMB 1770]